MIVIELFLAFWMIPSIEGKGTIFDIAGCAASAVMLMVPTAYASVP